MQVRSGGDGQPLAGGGSSPDSSFPKGTENAARPAFGDRTSVAIAVALMVALTLLFLPWSTIRPGLNEGGGNTGSGVGAAPAGPGPALNARIGPPTIGVVAMAQPLAVTLAGTGPGSGPIGPPTKHKPPVSNPGESGGQHVLRRPTVESRAAIALGGMRGTVTAAAQRRPRRSGAAGGQTAATATAATATEATATAATATAGTATAATATAARRWRPGQRRTWQRQPRRRRPREGRPPPGGRHD